MAYDVLVFHLIPDFDKPDMCLLVPDSRHPDGKLLFRHGFGCEPGAEGSYYIRSVKMKWAENYWNEPVTFEIQGLLLEGHGGIGHPDQSGIISFTVEPRNYGVLSQEEQLIYEPNHVNLGFDISPYFGLEHAILSGRSLAFPEEANPLYDVYQEGDPLLVFLKQHKEHPHFKNIEILQSKSNPLYFLVSKAGVEKVKQFFKDALFPMFVKADFGKARIVPPKLPFDPIKTNLDNGFACIIVTLEVVYRFIKKSVPAFKVDSKLLLF